jgi:beta-lactamase class A
VFGLVEHKVEKEMRWLLRLFLIPAGALAIVGSLAVAHPPLAVAPPIETPYVHPSQMPIVRAIEDLYQVRDQLKAELKKPGSSPTLTASGAFSTPTALLQMLQSVEIRIQVEESAKRSWAQTSVRAMQATKTAYAGKDESLKTLETIHALWQQAVNSLKAVPVGSLMSTAAAAKVKEYEAELKQAIYRYDSARSDFLRPIAEQTGLPLDQVHITVCHLEGECRRWYGNEPPASPASLIKLPIAIAVMQKVADENISLNTKILVSQGNYTEDASDVWVGAEYTLRHILIRMINQSSNIATNQLIDYVGRDKINQILRDRGYEVTRVNTKLVGESIYPANAGSEPNQTSMNELTEMMRQIYRQEHPGDAVLIDALASQQDTVLGYDGLRSTAAIWLGEKTGQNSKVLGTTLAMKIKGEDYVLSVALDHSGNELAVRRCINDVAKHITREGHL